MHDLEELQEDIWSLEEKIHTVSEKAKSSGSEGDDAKRFAHTYIGLPMLIAQLLTKYREYIRMLEQMPPDKLNRNL